MTQNDLIGACQNRVLVLLSHERLCTYPLSIAQLEEHFTMWLHAKQSTQWHNHKSHVCSNLLSSETKAYLSQSQVEACSSRVSLSVVTGDAIDSSECVHSMSFQVDKTAAQLCDHTQPVFAGARQSHNDKLPLMEKLSTSNHRIVERRFRSYRSRFTAAAYTVGLSCHHTIYL